MSGVVDAQPDTGAPPEPVLVTGNGVHPHCSSDAGDPLELFGHAGCFESALRGRVDVLEVASATPPRTGIGAGRCHPIGRGSEHICASAWMNDEVVEVTVATTRSPGSE